MQLLTDNPKLTPMYAKRKLNDMLGRVQNAAMDLDEIEAICRLSKPTSEVTPQNKGQR